MSQAIHTSSALSMPLSNLLANLHLHRCIPRKYVKTPSQSRAMQRKTAQGNILHLRQGSELKAHQPMAYIKRQQGKTITTQAPSQCTSTNETTLDTWTLVFAGGVRKWTLTPPLLPSTESTQTPFFPLDFRGCRENSTRRGCLLKQYGKREINLLSRLVDNPACRRGTYFFLRHVEGCVTAGAVVERGVRRLAVVPSSNWSRLQPSFFSTCMWCSESMPLFWRCIRSFALPLSLTVPSRSTSFASASYVRLEKSS